VDAELLLSLILFEPIFVFEHLTIYEGDAGFVAEDTDVDKDEDTSLEDRNGGNADDT
jgi:hypothetical protein